LKIDFSSIYLLVVVLHQTKVGGWVNFEASCSCTIRRSFVVVCFVHAFVFWLRSNGGIEKVLEGGASACNIRVVAFE